jgi:hypothetical protein
MSTLTDWAVATVAAIPADGLNKMFVLKNTIDFSEVNSGASDVVQVLAVPAGTMVVDVITKVVTPEGGTLTATVGDGSGASSWDGAVDLNAVAGTYTQSAAGTDAYATTAAKGKIYSSADTIDLTMSANAGDTAVLEVFAICYDLN